MSVSKVKEIHLPSKKIMVDKKAVYAMPVAALIVVLFTVLMTNNLTISLYLFVAIFFLLGRTKILVTYDLVITVMIMLLGLGIMAYSYDQEPLISSPLRSSEKGILSEDMFLTCIVCFVVFIEGYFYSFIFKRPFKTLRYIFLYGWALVGIYFMVFHGLFLGSYSLMLGNMTIILLPYMYLIFAEKPKSSLIFFALVFLYLLLNLCRTAFVATGVFFLIYYIYPYLVVNKRRYTLFFFVFCDNTISCSHSLSISNKSRFKFFFDIGIRFTRYF